MADPSEWGAVPVTPAAAGPAAWGAQPLDQPTTTARGFVPRYQQEVAGGLEHMKGGASRMLDFGSTSAIPESVKGLGEAALGAAQYVGAPLTAAIGRAFGDPAEDVGAAVGGMISPKGAEVGGQLGRGVAELGAGLLAPEIALGRLRSPVPPVAPVERAGVTLTKGQVSQDPVQLAREADARAGKLGTVAQRNALAFDEQQARQVTKQTENIRRGLDPGGQVLAPGPQEAAEVAQQGVQRQAAAAKARTDELYTEARGHPGEIDSIAFRNMGQKIREEMWQGTDPVIVQTGVTPYASSMIDYLSGHPSKIAREVGYKIPKGKQIAGLNLEMADRVRKRLSGMRRGAFASGKQEDMRAAARVLDEFDARIDSAIDTGLFMGDPLAVQAWKDARAAHVDYRATFRKGGRGDDVGRVMEKVIGRHGTDAAIPNDVADFMYGRSALNPGTKDVAVARRFKEVLGAGSPRWTAARQGMFSRLVEPGEGQTAFSHAKVAERLNKFLNGDGREMAAEIFTPAQRHLLQEYANLRRTIEDSPIARVPLPEQRLADRIAQYAAGHVAAGLGQAVGAKTGIPFLGSAAKYAAQKAVARAPAVKNAAQIARDMPVIGKAWQDYSKAAAAYEAKRDARNIARVTLATRNLDRNLRDIGTTMSALMTGTEQDSQQSGGVGEPGRQDRLDTTVPRRPAGNAPAAQQPSQ